MKQIRAGVPLLLAAGLLIAGDESAQNWENLRQLKTGEKIEVIDGRMKSHRGEFARVEDNSLSFTAKSGALTLSKADVVRVSVSGQSTRLRKTLLGAAIGGGVAVVASAAANARFANEGHSGYLYPILVPAGIGVGAALGASGSSFRTVYRAGRK